MKAMQRTTLMLALAGVLSMPSILLAADAAKDEHGGHHPEAAPVAANAPETATLAAADRMRNMRARMMEMRATQDPDKRMRLMEAQMKDVETMMQGQGQGGGMMGPGMMRGMMAPGQKGKDCPMGSKDGKGGMMGMQGQNDMTAKRMEMMEKRMDMMQMMMQMRMQGMGGMSMPAN